VQDCQYLDCVALYSVCHDVGSAGDHELSSIPYPAFASAIRKAFELPDAIEDLQQQIVRGSFVLYSSISVG
jgi:hypothetical protein